MNASSLMIEQIAKKIGARRILHNISFEILPGQVYALLGPNGSGKTTLLHILAGLSYPTKGQLLWQGKPVGRANGSYRAQVGFLGHEPLLYGNLTAKENLLFFTRLFRGRSKEQEIAEALQVSGLRWFADDLAGNFSRGMQQRLSLARLWLQSAELILLDEPFTGLDQQGSHWLEQMIRHWRENNKRVMLSLHDPSQAIRISDQYLLLRAGEMERMGQSDAADPDELKRRLKSGNL